MNQERFNKNGIRILDDPKKANQMRRRKPCLPDEHVWRFVSRDYNRREEKFECANCGDLDYRVDYYE